jgi:integrase
MLLVYLILGEPAKTVQELLGHSSINITLGTYIHVLEQPKIKTASLINSIYDEVKAEEPDNNKKQYLIPFG